MDMYTRLYLKCITNKDIPYSTWNSAQCYVAARMGGEFGGEWTQVYGQLQTGTRQEHLPAAERRGRLPVQLPSDTPCRAFRVESGAP